MKKTTFSLMIVGIVLFVLPNLNSCSKTANNAISAYGYDLGWNGDHAYVLIVQGIWDRNTYYIDGERNDLADLGKIPVSSFELRRQAELFARIRAVYTFQENMEHYFNNLDSYEYKEDEEILYDENSNEIFLDEDGNELPVEKNVVDNGLNDTTENTRIIISSNEKIRVFYENPDQSSHVDFPLSNQNPKPEASSTPSPQIKKTIDFRQVYDKVNLKITLIEKIYTIDNDVEIIYLFSGKNLKQELAKAFNISSGEIELQK